MAKRKFSRQQTWEIIIVSIILVIIIYRVALAYGYVPEEYRPSVVLGEAYAEFKVDLKAEVDAQGSFRYPAKWTLERLKGIEEYLAKRKLYYEKAERTAERCNENMLFRYFMYMGDEDNE